MLYFQFRRVGWMHIMWTFSMLILLYTLFSCVSKENAYQQDRIEQNEFMRQLSLRQSTNRFTSVNEPFAIASDFTDTETTARTPVNKELMEDNVTKQANDESVEKNVTEPVHKELVEKNVTKIDLTGAALYGLHDKGVIDMLTSNANVDISNVSQEYVCTFGDADCKTFTGTITMNENTRKDTFILSLSGDANVIHDMDFLLNTTAHLNIVVNTNLIPCIIRVPRPAILSSNTDENGSGDMHVSYIFMLDHAIGTGERENGSLQMLFMYLANCAVPKTMYYHDGNFVHLHQCLLNAPNIHKLNEQNQEQLTTLKMHLQQKENICALPKDVIRFLQSADDVVSTTPSVGSSVAKRLDPDNNATRMSINRVFEVSESIDGRVSKVVKWYTGNCENDTSTRLVETLTRTFLLTATVTKLDAIERHGGSKVMLLATLSDGQQAFVKFFQSCKHEFLGEGAKELISFYADRAFGFNRFPNVVVRRVFFKDDNSYSAVSTDGQNFNVSLNISSEDVTQLNLFMVKENESNYIDFVFIGAIKGFHRFDYDTEAIANVWYNNKPLDSMKGEHLTTLQTLRDVTNEVLFDFLTHNFDRRGDNWIRSELRVTPFDMGKSFDDVNGTHNLVCERMLQLPELHSLSSMFPDVTAGPLDRKVPHSCEAVPQKYRLCKFEKDTVDMIKMRGRGAISFIKEILQKEDKGHLNCLDPDKYDVFKGFELRLDYVLKYFDECYNAMAEDMYI